MKERLTILIRLFVTLLLIFVSQKIVFMVINVGHADGAPFGQCLLSLWHGLRLDTVTASYLVIIPTLVLLISCFFKRFPLRRVLRPYFWFAAILMAVVFIADTILYFFWGAKMDATELMFASKPKELFASLDWWSAATALVIVGLCCYLFYILMRRTAPETIETPKSRWSALFFLPLAVLVFLGMRGGVSKSTANPSYAYYSKHAFCNHSALNPLFNMIHSLFKAEDLDHTFNFMSHDEAAETIAPLFATDNSIADTLLNTQRPDILLITWEGGGWNMVMTHAKNYDGIDTAVAPNLQRCANEGVLFANCHASSFRTDRGVVSVLNGWPGLPTTSLMKITEKCRKLPSIAHELRKIGYKTRFVYGGDIGFTNMRCYLSETGFETVICDKDFADSRNKSNWGAPDEYTLTTSSLEPTTNSPSFTTLLTLSSHEPWEVPVRRFEDKRLNSFAYTDSCLGVMIDSLKASPRWGNLLVIIIPDHGIPTSTAQSTSEPSVAHIPMVWTGGAVRKHQPISALMSQSDLAATLLAQMGLPTDAFPLSRNVLGTEYTSRRHFANHAFKNGCNFIDSCGVTRFDCIDHSATTVEGNACDDHEMMVKAFMQHLYHLTAKL